MTQSKGDVGSFLRSAKKNAKYNAKKNTARKGVVPKNLTEDHQKAAAAKRLTQMRQRGGVVQIARHAPWASSVSDLLTKINPKIQLQAAGGKQT